MEKSIDSKISMLQHAIRFFISTMLLSFFWVTSVNASPVDTFEFKDEATQLRFQVLSKELRCPKCQNQNLADSNSKIAVDLRNNLYNLLQEGMSDQEVIDFMVYRYGDFVLYRPPLKEQTYILWFGPLVILFGFIISVIFVLRKRSQVKANEHDLSTQEQANLDDILNKQ
ncbi:cytochrome c-type biogenesis protein [Colwellia sp. MB02u-6]|uniref:cytochrome c-type biogenesis protein n=1 Tax=Colwellia sp. MB02u-6 TaxID=2759824 RepID=UPI002175561C|nr:cytochrome c-type biogenesis protein [Colwellia sp. MB02u-6]